MKTLDTYRCPNGCSESRFGLKWETDTTEDSQYLVIHCASCNSECRVKLTGGFTFRDKRAS